MPDAMACVRASKAVRGKTQGVYQIKPLATNVCRVTLVQQAGFGGNISKQLMSYRVMSTLKQLKRLEYKYMRNGDRVDAERREESPGPPQKHQLNNEQMEIVARCEKLAVGLHMRNWKKIDSPSRLVEMWMQYSQPTGEENSR
jgi:hypothetical protein